jgi:hypothetical protein
MIEATKIEGQNLSLAAWTRSKMGAMCSDRETLYRLEIKENGPSKWLSIITTYDSPDVPCDPNCVRIQYFKAAQIEQVGEDLHTVEFQSMDLQGYFPKSLMNKI